MARPLLRGKSIVIIGGTTGLGLSAARAFIQQGARVVVVGRNADNVKAAQRQLGRMAHALAGDARDSQCAEAAIRHARKHFGRLHGLYHVAGGSGRSLGDGPLHEMSDTGWRGTIELNLSSVIFSNRAAVRQFLAQGGGGTVLNMGSVLGSSPSPKFFATHAYAAAKSAIIGFTRAVASYYAAENIRFNVLAPGLVETPMAKRAAAEKAIQQFIRTKQPLDGGRIAQPKDLDAAAIYFMSDESRFTTGQVLTVDGGWCLSEGQSPGKGSRTRKPARKR